MSLLPLVEFAFNNSCHVATKQSPFFPNYGLHPTFLPDLVPESSAPAMQSTLDFFSRNSMLLQEAVTKAQEDNKRVFDKRRRLELILQPGDQVWLATTNLKLVEPEAGT